MAELNLNQIVEKLNAEFAKGTRTLVFWYDDNADFEEDIDSISLENAKVHRLTKTNQFRTKLLLERQDTTGNYLIYAPFPKPPVEENHLEDTLLYSKRFYADRASLICVDLGIPEREKPVIKQHIKYFADKGRTKRFYDLMIDHYTKGTIETGLMSAICGLKTASFEEVVRVILTEENLAENRYLAEFEKYGLLGAFWKACADAFGYTDESPTLDKFVTTLFVTYTAKVINGELPQEWKQYLTFKPGNIMAFLDSLMNNILYRESFNRLSALVERSLSAGEALSKLPLDALTECDTFLCVDRLLVKWICERLVDEDTGAKLNGISIPDLCLLRKRKHFAVRTEVSYTLLAAAWHIISSSDYRPAQNLIEIEKKYISEDYRIDRWYRSFVQSLDKLEQSSAFGKLRDLVENIYTNEYLGHLLPAWNAVLDYRKVSDGIPQQIRFYLSHVRNLRERVVVIISDAMRYEVGTELMERLQEDPNSTVKLTAQLSVLPSYTALGMAALLPHDKITMTDDYKVLIDGKTTDSLAAREAILQSVVPQSACVRFDTLRHMKTAAELRRVLTGKQVVYVYQNQIDARGEAAQTEDEVFESCEEAVDEIVSLIHRIATNGNTYRFIVTSDHGFLYKRDALKESDKISHAIRKGAFTDRRFIVDEESVVEDGVKSVRLGDVLGNDDSRQVSFPVSASVFTAGGGMNYVHGGSSPQEMIVPVLDVKMERYHMETRIVGIELLSIVRKITSLITSLDFIQTEAVSDTVKAATFRIFFRADDGEPISNECILKADNRGEDLRGRVCRLTFTLKNQKYDPTKPYYLVAVDAATGMEAFRRKMVIDIAFADDYGFLF